jgi:hypothetical protein|tara:strand:+ start:1198 stop:2073 length:876 start_codon:yes stop_codon:yes gene_type:complete
MMAKLPKMQPPTIAEIYHQIHRAASPWQRDHLGCSGLGDDCERKIWYSWRWWRPPEFDGRILRLFRRGEIEETWLISDLRSAGVQVSEGPDLGRQWRTSALGGHLGGSMDAALLGLKEAPKTWHCAEFKTHNKKSFDDLEKKRVRKSKPMHYAQMQLYCHLFGLSRWAYFAVCKDDDRIYYERGEYDRYYAGELVEKARRIIEASEPPAKISEREDYYQCRWCHHREACQQEIIGPVKTCRSCKHGRPIIESQGGTWVCRLSGDPLSGEEQRKGCAKYNQIGSQALPVFGG